MKPRSMCATLLALVAGAFITLFGIHPSRVLAQNPELQQRLTEVKQAAAQNKMALAHYTWQEQEMIALKGDVKDTKVFQVRIGPDGRPQKTELTNAPASDPSGGRLKRHIVEKKKGELEEYGEQIGALAQQYAHPDPSVLQQAYQQGNVMLGSAGIPGQAKIVISNYIKPNDKVTLVFNQQARAIQSMDIATYLNDPADAVTIGAQFSRLPDGTNHVSTMQINGASKHLLVTTQNSNYQKM